MERLQSLVLFKTLLSLQIMVKMKIMWIGNVRRKMRVLHQIMYFNVHNGSMLSCHFSILQMIITFISIKGNPNDANRHHLPHTLRVM